MMMSNIDNSNLHYWVTDEQEGMTLHIAGTGRMPDYDDTFEGGASWPGFNRLVVHEGVGSLGAYAFYRSQVAEVILPASLRYVGKHCFEGCRRLLRLTWPSGVPEILSSTFKDCVSLQEVELTEQLRVIWRWAFQNCEALERIRIPKAIERISTTAFWGVDLNGLMVEGSRYDVEDGCLYCGDRLITAGRGMKQIVVRPGTRVISDYAFYRNDGVEEVILPNSVERIEKRAFAHCVNLRAIETGNRHLHLDAQALLDCPADIVTGGEPSCPLTFSTARVATTRRGYAVLRNGRISCSSGAVNGDATPLLAYDDFIDIQGGFDYVLGLRRNGEVVSSVKPTPNRSAHDIGMIDIGDGAFPNHVRFTMPMRQIAAAESRIAGIDIEGMLFESHARTFEQADFTVPRIAAKSVSVGYDAVLYIDTFNQLRLLGYEDWNVALKRNFTTVLEKSRDRPMECKMYSPYYCTPTIAVLTSGKRLIWCDLPWGMPKLFPPENIERFAVGSSVVAAVNSGGEAFVQFNGGDLNALPCQSRVVDVGLIHSEAAILLCEDSKVVIVDL